ncbi:MAG: ThuA domain-containing protein [Promethearchaeota archaeon]
MNLATWIGGRKGHPYKKVARILKKILLTLDDVSIASYTSKNLLDEDELKKFDAIVSYTQGGWILLEKEMNALTQFIKNGGGFIGIHGATASFKKNPEYHELLGARFIGHGLPRKFNSHVLNEKHFITKNIKDFFIFDEPYKHNILKKDLDILIVRKEKSKDEPLVFTNVIGEGRIVYLAFGHFAKNFNDENIQELIRRSVIWASRKKDK